MSKTVIAEGKTTSEAIENGLKELKVSKDMVEVKTLEADEKRSFFSILAPRIVKVQLTLKEDKEKHHNTVKEEKKIAKIDEDILVKAEENIDKFLKEFKEKANLSELNYDISKDEFSISVNAYGKDAGVLIGYRGETLNAMQSLLSSIAGKGLEQKIRVILDIEGYRGKREKTLEDLAEKIARSVVKSGKSITLEPMSAYERKIIHSKLQNNKRVATYSVGEEPYRKLVVSLNKNKY